MSGLLIVTGPPGAGKSTVAGILADRAERSVLVEGDAFFDFLAAGAVEPWLPESHRQNKVVTEAAGAATACFVRAGYETVFDGIVGPWFLPTFAAAAGLRTLDYVVLLPSVEQCLERVASRSGHEFSNADATRKMHHEFERAASESSFVFRDDEASAETAATVIAESRTNGELRWESGRPSS